MIDLNSYMIEDDNIAEEGVVGAFIAGMLALPVIAFGALSIVSGIHVAKESRKLHKLIKQNSGNAAMYDADSYNILTYYRNDINGVIEPDNYAKYYTLYQAIDNILNKSYALRGEFMDINPYSDSASMQYSALKKKIDPIIKSINKIKFPDISNVRTTGTMTISLEQSYINKILEIDSEIFKKNSYIDAMPLKSTVDMSETELDRYEKMFENPVAKEISGDYTEAIKRLLTELDSFSYNLLTKCKFAVNPKAKKKKLKLN